MLGPRVARQIARFYGFPTLNMEMGSHTSTAHVCSALECGAVFDPRLGGRIGSGVVYAVFSKYGNAVFSKYGNMRFSPNMEQTPNMEMGILTSTAHVCLKPLEKATAVLRGPRSTDARFVPMSAESRREIVIH